MNEKLTTDKYIGSKYNNCYLLEEGMQVYTYRFNNPLLDKIGFTEDGFWYRQSDIDTINRFDKIGFIFYKLGLRDPRTVDSKPLSPGTYYDGYEMVVIGNLK